MMTNNKAINILLVEDDDGDAKALQRAFFKAKIVNEITRAIDGIDALDLLKGNKEKQTIMAPYLILVDINMPRMNGIEFVKNLRNDSKLCHSTVFMLTTSKREEDKIAAYDLNVSGYILKEKVGEDFLRLVELIDIYWRIVELPC